MLDFLQTEGAQGKLVKLEPSCWHSAGRDIRSKRPECEVGWVRRGKPGSGKTLEGPSSNPFKILATWLKIKTSQCFLGITIAMS